LTAVYPGITTETDPVAEADLATHVALKRNVHGIPATVAQGDAIVGDGSGGFTTLALPALPPITPQGSVRRQRVRNDFTNPRLVGLTKVTHSDFNVNTPTLTALTNDPDLGYCAEYSGTALAGASPTITFSDAANGVPIIPGQVAFMRVSLKLMVAATANDVPVTMSARIFQSNGSTVVSARTIATTSRLVLGQVITLEGFEYGQAAAALAALRINFPLPDAGVWTIRVGKPQISIDPDGQAPAYIDGSMWNGAWIGAADASASEGWVDAPKPPAGFLRGFNDTTIGAVGSNNATAVMSNEQNVALQQEFGATISRIGMGDVPDPLNANSTHGAQPTAGDPVNWRNVPWLTSWCDTLRAHGLQWCPLIGSAMKWMTLDNSGSLTQLDPAQHGRWVALWQALVQTWPDVITHVEFMNEPNLVAGGNIPGATYTSLMRELYTGIKAVAPTCKFLGASLARYFGTDASGTDMGTYLTAMYTAGAKGFMDGISLHPYPSDPSSAWPACRPGTRPGSTGA
jgi:hypothetical protein